MRLAQKIAAVALLAAAGAAIYGLKVTNTPSNGTTNGTTKKSQALTVDDSSLTYAQQLAPLADTDEEKELARAAVDKADHEVDVAYDTLLRRIEADPPPTSEETKTLEAKKTQAEKLLDSLQAKLEQLTVAQEKSTGEKKAILDVQVAQVESSAELAENEVNDATQDLEREGGDPKQLVQKLRAQHKALADKAQKVAAAPQISFEEKGLIHRYQQWSTLHAKYLKLAQARAAADAAVQKLSGSHDALEDQIEKTKQATPGLTQKKSIAPGGSSAEPGVSTLSQQDANSLLEKTQSVVNAQKDLAAFDSRIDYFKSLSEIYTSWISIVEMRQRAVLHRVLIGLLIIVAILLIGLFFNTWMEKIVGKLKLDRRQVQTLRAVTRVTLQVIAVLFVLLVIFGPPTQLGTFIGLATAGLTVALKDFIVGFLGWFVLMGKNGVRLGDWVEINGVTGEVVEIGMFHTVLLETGNWTDSGHPTGRRVTFTNGYAIEGHYFNFSTSGQWLWDELQLTLPQGQDPFSTVEAIQKKVMEETQSSTEQAEKEWKTAAGSREMSNISAAPAINMRPSGGGIQLQVRYVTRASERYQMRTKLYQAAVELLGGKAASMPPPKA